LRGQAKLILSGRKEEVIDRLANFTVSLIANNKRSSVAAIVAIVNNKASRRYFIRLYIKKSMIITNSVEGFSGDLKMIQL
jgi:hypothetical protein